MAAVDPAPYLALALSPTQPLSYSALIVCAAQGCFWKTELIQRNRDYLTTSGFTLYKPDRC